MKATFGPPRTPSDVEDRKVKRQLEALTDGGRRPINDFVVPYVPSFTMRQGSTDVGDVSWLAPTAQFTTATWISGSPGHSWQNVATGTHSIAHKGMLLAAKVLAATTADLLENPALLTEAREEFQDATEQGYDCPIGKEVTF
jgi:aminobenzoyl-glutamate utilization protein B